MIMSSCLFSIASSYVHFAQSLAQEFVCIKQILEHCRTGFFEAQSINVFAAYSNTDYPLRLQKRNQLPATDVAVKRAIDQGNNVFAQPYVDWLFVDGKSMENAVNRLLSSNTTDTKFGRISLFRQKTHEVAPEGIGFRNDKDFVIHK